MTIGEKLALIGLLKKLNQKELAEKLNVTQSTISRYQKDERIPDYNLLKNLVEKLNVNPSWLLSDSNQIFTDSRISSNEE